MMTMKSMKYQECDTIMDNYNPVPPPLPRRVPPIRNIYAEPFETNTSRWVPLSIMIPLLNLLSANNRNFQSHFLDCPRASFLSAVNIQYGKCPLRTSSNYQNTFSPPPSSSPFAS